MNLTEIFNELHLSTTNAGTSTGTENHSSNSYLSSFSPIDGQKLAEVSVTSKEQYEALIHKAQEAATHWRSIPAPK